MQKHYWTRQNYHRTREKVRSSGVWEFHPLKTPFWTWFHLGSVIDISSWWCPVFSSLSHVSWIAERQMTAAPALPPKCSFPLTTCGIRKRCNKRCPPNPGRGNGRYPLNKMVIIITPIMMILKLITVTSC